MCVYVVCCLLIGEIKIIIDVIYVSAINTYIKAVP